MIHTQPAVQETVEGTYTNFQKQDQHLGRLRDLSPPDARLVTVGLENIRKCSIVSTVLNSSCYPGQFQMIKTVLQHMKDSPPAVRPDAADQGIIKMIKIVNRQIK